jgi:hypothetical protein
MLVVRNYHYSKEAYVLSISKKDYEEIYFGLQVPPYELFSGEPTSDEDYIMNYVSSKLYRLNTLYTIIDKAGKKIPFVMNRAQHVVFSAHMRHPRVVILKSRQQGISTFYLINYFDKVLFEDNINVGMQSYGLEESAALLKRLDVAWDNFPSVMKEFMGLRVVKSNTKALGFSNGSQIKVQTSFRGDTLQGLHVSELGKIANKNPHKAVELSAGTLQAIAPGNPVAYESTAEGRHNAFYDIWYKAENHVGDRSLKDFYPVFLSWVDDPDCTMRVPMKVDSDDADYIDEVERELEIKLSDEQKWWCVAQRRELGDMFNQEYPYSADAAFAAVRDGTYYTRLWRQVGTVVEEGLYDPVLGVMTSWDLGMNDTMEIGFWQLHFSAGIPSIRLVDYYYNSGEGLRHYVRMLRDKNYKYERHFMPHDVKVKELGSNVSRLGLLKEMGMRNITVLKRTNNVSNDIEVVRSMLKYLTIDKSKCSRVIEMMYRYTKEWDTNLGVFKDKPRHDEWSNPADMVRYFAMSGIWKTKKTMERKKSSSKSNVADGVAL